MNRKRRDQNGRIATVLDIVRSVVAPLTRTRLDRSAAPRALPTLDRALRRLSGGRAQLSGLLVPSLVLHSRPWPGYRAYERQSGRTVRLFLLQPVASCSLG